MKNQWIAKFLICMLASLLIAGPALAESVFPKLISPNSDGINDLVFFVLENKTGMPFKGSIYDLKSQKIADVKESSVFLSDHTILFWDGKDETGSSVPVGVYVYKIEIGENRYTGTIGVAR